MTLPTRRDLLKSAAVLPLLLSRPRSQQGKRATDVAGLARVRAELALRFPRLADAPLVEARVCQYENSPDGDFIIDRHPEASNVWLVGGGSGHGYKLGPALGEYVAGLASDQGEPREKFRLSRFSDPTKKRSTQMEKFG